MKFTGEIEEVVSDYCKDGVSHRLFIKMYSFNARGDEDSIYCRVQGRKAQMILDHMDPDGTVEGCWTVELHPTVRERVHDGRIVLANLLHVTHLRYTELLPEGCEGAASPVRPNLPAVVSASDAHGFATWFKNNIK